jgi:hypothetical protein
MRRTICGHDRGSRDKSSYSGEIGKKEEGHRVNIEVDGKEGEYMSSRHASLLSGCTSTRNIHHVNPLG